MDHGHMLHDHQAHQASEASFDQLGLASYDASLLINRSYKAFNSLLKTCLSHHGLTIPKWSLLGNLYQHGSLRPGELAKAMGVKAPFASTVALHLESEGFVKASAVEDDDRGKSVELTLEGRTLVERVEPMLRDCLNGQLGGLTRAQLSEYFAAADYMAANVKHH